MNNSKFRNLRYQAVQQEIENSSDKSAIYVGCDSKLNGSGTLFGLVIIIHVDGHKGGMVFGSKQSVARKMEMRERLMKEVDIAMECAFSIYEFTGGRTFEVHLDLNPDPEFKSNILIKEAISYVKAQGFDFQIKPNAWAATTAADYLIN